MIYCLIKGRDCIVQHTFPNNKGIITLFLIRGNSSNVSCGSFSMNEFKNIEEFLIFEYGAKIVNNLSFDF